MTDTSGREHDLASLIFLKDRGANDRRPGQDSSGSIFPGQSEFVRLHSPSVRAPVAQQGQS